MSNANEQTPSAPETVDDADEGFNAVITPHRSLGPRGFLVLMATIACISFGAGMVFFMMGAWPVLGFFGLDVLLIYLAFKLSYFSARAEEQVQLSEDTLLVRRISATGRVREWTFNPYWVKVDFAEFPDGSNSLALISHGSRLDIASYLSPAEKADFADALRGALKLQRG